MNVSLYIARHLSLSKDGRHRSPAVAVAIAGVALSIAVMILSIAIVLGFKQNIRDKVMGFSSHITLRAGIDESGDPSTAHIDITPDLQNAFDHNPQIKHWQAATAVPAILKTDTDFEGMYLKGVGKGYDFSFLQSDMVEGSIPDFSAKTDIPPVLLSDRVAKRLRLKTGDKINVYFVDPGVRVRPMKIAGIYDTHFEDYDNLYLYGPIEMVNELCGLEPEQARSIEINVTEPTEDIFQSVTTDINRYFATTPDTQSPISVSTVYESGASYFSWLALLDTNVIVILSLMVLLSCFTLISCMLILILERVKTIGLLKSLGATHRQVRRIFVWMARRITIVGILAGNAIALFLIFLQAKWHIVPLDAESYYIDYVPVQFNLIWLLAVNAGAIALIWASLILPSHIVARISPATTLRSE